jgi:hypothetical protein
MHEQLSKTMSRLSTIEDLANVPPALYLLLHEISKFESWPDMRKCVRGMLRDLRDQSEGWVDNDLKQISESQNSLRFEMHLHGELDLLSGDGCGNFDCRLKAADRIARSAALISDRVWLSDTLSTQFLDFGRATNEKIDNVIRDALVLVRLLPLIHAGIIKFRLPYIQICSSCAANFVSETGCSSKKVTQIFRRDFQLEALPDEGFFLNTGKCINPSISILLHHSPEIKAKPNLRDVAEEFVVDQLRSTLLVAREASLTGGSIFTNSRVGLAGLLQIEGRLLDRRTLLLMDKEREFSVPWVSELDAKQILQLREEASTALPLFREKMAKAMSISSLDTISNSTPSMFIEELREQAAEVRAELNIKRKHSSRYWKTTYGLLGLGLSAYGIATDQITPGIGGLLPILQLLINHKSGHEAEVSKLTSRSSYVLVKAQDILAHAH